MPVSISYYVRKTTTDASFGRPPEKPADEVPVGDVTTTQRGERFTGYHLTYDEHGNIIKQFRPADSYGIGTASVEFSLDLRAP